MSGLSALQVAALATAALLAGFAKTAIGGVSAISVAVFAAVLPARSSTGALLPLLLVGDLMAVGTYRRHAQWGTLLRLFPSVAVGVLIGAVFVSVVDDTVMRRTIGVVLLLLIGLHLWWRRFTRVSRARAAAHPAAAGEPGGTGDVVVPFGRHRHAVTFVAGLLAGFTTMVANAGGAVMALYLLSAGMGVLGFLGTGAWFFFLVNLFKVPFNVGLGLINVPSLTMDAVLAPAVVAGALVGRRVVRHLDVARFEQLVIVFTVLSGLNLLR